MKKQIIRAFLLYVICGLACGTSFADSPGKVADKPLYRDPVFDGAADPVVIWNQPAGKWFMYYTNRRSTLEHSNGVDWVHGTKVGIAESDDGGATWKYRGTCEIDCGEGETTYWAPEVVEKRRSSIQVAELKFDNGVIRCDRDAPCSISLKTVQ